jgi:hypothetical protein
MSNVDYRQLMNHFEQLRAKRQAEFRKEMEGIEETIAGLRKMLSSQPQGALFDINPRQVTANPVGKYAGLSVRWAILNLLSEDVDGPLPTSKIAELLTIGGITSQGETFTSNVSAVISDMKNKKHEVESTASGYQLTDTGRVAWDAIKQTHRYANRVSASASVLPV